MKQSDSTPTYNRDLDESKFASATDQAEADRREREGLRRLRFADQVRRGTWREWEPEDARCW